MGLPVKRQKECSLLRKLQTAGGAGDPSLGKCNRGIGKVVRDRVMRPLPPCQDQKLGLSFAGQTVGILSLCK